MKRSYLLCLLVLLGSLASCKKDPSEDGSPSESRSATKYCKGMPEFQRDSAYAYVEKQVSFGPRVPGTEAHAQCADWMRRTLVRHGAEVKVQSFLAEVYTGEKFTGKNIIGAIKPRERDRILLCAHWDSRPFSDHDPDPSKHDQPVIAANDGASGVGVLLELARVFAQSDIPIGVDIILFDLEDYGDADGNDATTWGLGSQHWSRTRHEPGYRAEYGILLDMVGAKGAVFPKELFSQRYAGKQLDNVWNIAHLLGYNDLFSMEDGGAVTDDHYFINTIAGIPTIDIIHLDKNSTNKTFFSHWHTTTDDMSHIDKRTLGAVGDVLMNVLCREAAE